MYRFFIFCFISIFFVACGEYEKGYKVGYEEGKKDGWNERQNQGFYCYDCDDIRHEFR